MSKKSSKSSYLAGQRKEKMLQAQKVRNRNKLIKKCACVFGCLVAAVLAVILCVNIVLDSGLLMGSAVIKGDTFKVTKGMLSYYIYEQYEYFLDYYGDSLSALSFDKDKSLKKQYYNESQTFFEFFADTAYENALAYMYYSEAAADAGYDLSDSAKQALKERAAEYDTSLYGRGVDTSDIYDALYLATLAAEYNGKIYDESGATAEEIENYKAEDPVSCQRVDYLVYSVEYAKDDDTARSDAKAASDTIALAATADEFKLEAVKHYTDGKITVLDESDEAVQKVIEQMESNNSAYTDDTLGNWLFGNAQVNETKVIQNTTKNCYNVYMLVTAPYFDTQKTVNVRHILVSYDDFESTDSAKAEAERIYAEFGSGTEEDFAVLAYRYSSDTGSFATGGLYKRVQQGEMVEEFDEWCFDESRRTGDTGIIATSYGYHIMYYCGDSLLNWQVEYYESVADSGSADAYSDFIKNIVLTEKQDIIYSLPERKK